jgi:hypothetical protein
LLGDGSSSINIATLLSLRDINVGVSTGMTIFYDGSKWVPSIPDTEIDHGTLTGLADDDHAQYALLAGRSSGQSLNGGTGASENLTLDSTAHATKGSILIKSNLTPNTTAAYSAGWTGTDLGSSSKLFNDVYSAGEFKGLRLENFTGADPSASSQNVGRMIYRYDINTIKIDTGGSWSSFVSASAFLQNGNSFAADAYIGTNDDFDFYLERNNIAKARLVTTGLELVDSDLVMNYGAAGSGADWKATIRRPSSGMTAASIITLPSATSTLATLGLAETFSALKTFSAGLDTTYANVTSSTIPANGIYLPSASVLGLTQNSTLRWTVRSVGLYAETTTPVIGINTPDGADNGILQIWGGGANDVGRGAGINLLGNENAETGKLRLYGGNVSGGNIEFYTGNAVAAMVINQTDQSVVPQKLLDLSTATAGQIKFPGSQNPSADANTLDDYEESDSWTPVANVVTFATAKGTYVKIGQFVIATFTVVWPSTADGGTAQIGGFPFTTATSGNNTGAGANITYTDYGNPITLLIGNNSVNGTVYSYSGASLTNANLSTKEVRGVAIYKASA